MPDICWPSAPLGTCAALITQTLRVFHTVLYMDTSLSTFLVAPCETHKHHGTVPDRCGAASLKAKGYLT